MSGFLSLVGLHDISCRDDNRDMRMRDIHIAGRAIFLFFISFYFYLFFRTCDIKLAN